MERPRERFGQSNKARLFQALKDVSWLSQEDMDIASYYTKVRQLWDKSSAMSNIPKCTCAKCECEINKRLLKYVEEQRLIQFLMGLNGSYTAVRGNILMMSPFPAMSQAYSLLVQEEKQRQVKNESHFLKKMHLSLLQLTSQCLGKMMQRSLHYSAITAIGLDTLLKNAIKFMDILTRHLAEEGEPTIQHLIGGLTVHGLIMMVRIIQFQLSLKHILHLCQVSMLSKLSNYISFFPISHVLVQTSKVIRRPMQTI